MLTVPIGKHICLVSGHGPLGQSLRLFFTFVWAETCPRHGVTQNTDELRKTLSINQHVASASSVGGPGRSSAVMAQRTAANGEVSAILRSCNVSAK